MFSAKLINNMDTAFCVHEFLLHFIKYLTTVSRPALGPTQPPIQWVARIFFPGSKATGAWRQPLTSTKCWGQEFVELYLHSPSTSSWRGAYNFTLTKQKCAYFSTRCSVATGPQASLFSCFLEVNLNCAFCNSKSLADGHRCQLLLHGRVLVQLSCTTGWRNGIWVTLCTGWTNEVVPASHHHISLFRL